MTKIVYAVFYALSLLPMRVLYMIADVGYLLVYHVVRYRRKLVRRNLSTSFPEMSAEEIRRTERKFYQWFCDYFLEAVKLLSISDSELRKRLTVVNSEEVEQYFSEGQDAAGILGHYCNWEWLSCVGINLPPERQIGLIYHPYATRHSTISSSASARMRRTAVRYLRTIRCVMLWNAAARACVTSADISATKDRSGQTSTFGCLSSIIRKRLCSPEASE